ncbi:MAG: hypothetical protein K8S97_11870 [Anaerolineae bacterium]|nr:hypothetical protein [Anaerolineae bacterium]
MPDNPSKSRLNDNRVVDTRRSLALELIVSLFVFSFFGLYAVGLLWQYHPQALIRYWRARHRYHRLLNESVIIDGTLTAIHATQQKNDVYAIEAHYQTHDPVTWTTITGTQRRTRDDLMPDDFPPPGTPVQIVYAGGDAHFML